jgi:predicted ATP-dependent endonuclease of OLD family
VIRALAVRDLRSLHDVRLELGPVSALVGEGRAGSSSLLLALRALLDPLGGVLAAGDVREGADALAISATLRDGRTAAIDGRPPALHRHGDPSRLPALLVLGAADGDAAATVDAFEQRLAAGLRNTVVLADEPELHLRPQAQRWYARLLHRAAEQGNQVVYATRSPAFLNVARLHELVYVERRTPGGTAALRPPALTPDEDFRVLSEFDAERAELLLARAALLVEGETEKLALPFVFAALGADPDREGITIVECGGKPNMVLFARVCAAAGIPFAVLYDRDARPGRHPSAANRVLHARLRELAGPDRAIELAPDFEAVAHLHRGGSHKPEQAWRRFARLPVEAMPGGLVRAARVALALAGVARSAQQLAAVDHDL